MPRATEKIVVDGKLDDAAWQKAAVLDTFFETYPADNAEPKVKTVVYLTYDGHDFYVGIHAFDPEPGKIRAPFVERDKIVGTDDNVAVFLDARNDRRSAIELRVNPRGNQADAVYNDNSGNEDFSPDFFYDTAAQITADGWTAEMKIPLSSLRYPKKEENHWGILVWRNYPRDQRYAFHSSPIDRGSNCWICHSRELTGLKDLPAGGHFVGAPYVTGQRLGETRNGLGSPLEDRSAKADGGVDIKWT
ncbi:MAG TPA: carbohydrate binding family 9 domain-containing protein, partial [Thermoanaerobaculia bacterium]